MNYRNLPDNALIRQRQLLPIIGLSAATLWRRVANDQFPKPKKLSARVTAWKWGEVRAWLDEVSA